MLPFWNQDRGCNKSRKVDENNGDESIVKSLRILCIPATELVRYGGPWRIPMSRRAANILPIGLDTVFDPDCYDCV